MLLTHPSHKVTSFEHIGSFTLRVHFDDGTTRTINFEPILEGAYYEQLRDPLVFQSVKIDPDFHTLVWENDADFNPNTLHDWDEMLPVLIERAEKWRHIHENA